MIKLSKEQVLKLHASLIKATGGSDGIRDEGMLDMNCLTAKKSYVMSFLRWHPVILAKRKFYNGLLSINNKFLIYESEIHSLHNRVNAMGISFFVSAKAQFMILQQKAQEWTHEFIGIDYDKEIIIKELQESGLEKAAPYWTQITKHLILTMQRRKKTLLLVSLWF